VVEREPRLWLSRSFTTRGRRPGEAEDAYVFVDRQTFQRKKDAGGFLESAEFMGELYGTPFPDPPAGYDMVLEIDLQGAEQVTGRHRDAVLILLLTPTAEVQAERLRNRGEDDQTISARLEIGRHEEELGRRIADEIVINDDIDQAVSQVMAIIDARRTRLANPPRSEAPRRIPMARRRPTLMDPPVEELLNKVDSKFTLVALSSKRARQINSYYNQLGESMGAIVPPQVTSVSGKPLTIAFEEIATSKTTYHRTDVEVEVEETPEGADLVAVVETVEPALEPGELTLSGVADAAVVETPPAPDEAESSSEDGETPVPAS
jgi:guanylate kinase